ncbi:hypothetical protein SUDANB176_00270 [Streptomyces sp. enrichment culture]|uniref:hypothetical protein n=1 Tax=Streptomyces sp. enrichment culture TaxID=1795815 RepID=UPI003F572165
MARAYVKSMRQRTASAACRSDGPGRRSTQTVAGWAGERPGRPSHGYQPAKSSSSHSPSDRSRTHIAVVPSGLLARALRPVGEGTCSPERGRRDNGHSNDGIGPRTAIILLPGVLTALGAGTPTVLVGGVVAGGVLAGGGALAAAVLSLHTITA